MIYPAIRTLALAVIVLAFHGIAWSQKAVVVQVVSGPFDNPEGSVVGRDGRTVFVSNAAARTGEFSFEVGGGYVTKLSIDAKGRLSVDSPKFVTGLTRPFGMAVLPSDVGSLPAGTVFVGVGGPPLAGKEHARDFQPGVAAFDPNTGRLLGQIYGGLGSPFEAISQAPLITVNGLAFSPLGDLYFADTGHGWTDFPESGLLTLRTGVWRVDASRLEDLLADGRNVDPTRTHGLTFCHMAGAPDGIEFSPDGRLFVNTVGALAAEVFGGPLYDPFAGAIYQVTEEDFDAGYMLHEPFLKNLGALDGLVFTPKGTMICTELQRTSDILLVQPDFGAEEAVFLQVPDLTGPADVSVANMGGRQFVIIPEHTSGSDVEPRDDQVTVVELIE